jgi:hypothetical protein
MTATAVLISIVVFDARDRMTNQLVFVDEFTILRNSEQSPQPRFEPFATFWTWIAVIWDSNACERDHIVYTR